MVSIFYIVTHYYINWDMQIFKRLNFRDFFLIFLFTR